MFYIITKLFIPQFQNALKQDNHEATQQSKEALYEVYGFLEKFLANGPYMVGNSLTVADFSILSSLSSVNLIVPVDAAKFPKLAEWLGRMEKLPFYSKANGIGLKKVAQFIEKLKAAIADKK